MIDGLSPNLIIAIEVISFCIIALLGIAVAIRAASLYARYKAAKKVSVPVEDGKVLKITQDEGNATIICREISGVPAEGAEEQVAVEDDASATDTATETKEEAPVVITPKAKEEAPVVITPKAKEEAPTVITPNTAKKEEEGK